ncbi:MAG: hypothetical protein GX589_04915 [Deltaproteobacteria bacterium]|nr:hypothetical protein [Deltaproteobacteria bacterium]
MPRFKSSKPSLIGIALVALGMLCGCSQEPVARDIDQRQALEIVALLNSQGLGAELSKERQGYVVKVRKSVFPQAVALINDSKLPGEAKMSFRQLVGEQGIIPSSREVESLRLDHALAVEIEDILENHAAVASARVVVRLNSRAEGAAVGASVVVQERPGSKASTGELAPLVLAAVPGLARENLQISVTPMLPDPRTAAELGKVYQDGKVLSVPLAPFLFWRVPEASLASIVVTFVGVLVLALLVGMLVGYALAVYRHARTVVSSDVPEGVPLLSLKMERHKKSILKVKD